MDLYAKNWSKLVHRADSCLVSQFCPAAILENWDWAASRGDIVRMFWEDEKKSGTKWKGTGKEQTYPRVFMNNLLLLGIFKPYLGVVVAQSLADKKDMCLVLFEDEQLKQIPLSDIFDHLVHPLTGNWVHNP